MKLDITHLNKVTDAASDGIWYAFSFGDTPSTNPEQAFGLVGPERRTADRMSGYKEEDAVFIATFSPMKVKKLLVRLEQLEKQTADYQKQFRSHFFYMFNARRFCDEEMRRSPNWALASELFA